MQFNIQLIDDPAHLEKRKENVEAHWAYFDEHRDNFVARGATGIDDLSRTLSSVIFVDFDSWDAVRHFVDNEPFNRAGLFRDIQIRRWQSGFTRLQRDYPRADGQVYWYVRGAARAGATADAEAQREFLAAQDDTTVIVHGALFDEAGESWQGSASLICRPSRADIEAFVAEWPDSRNGLYEDVLIQRYRFGGRPGQTV